MGWRYTRSNLVLVISSWFPTIRALHNEALFGHYLDTTHWFALDLIKLCISLCLNITYLAHLNAFYMFRGIKAIVQSLPVPGAALNWHSN